MTIDISNFQPYSGISPKFIDFSALNLKLKFKFLASKTPIVIRELTGMKMSQTMIYLHFLPVDPDQQAYFVTFYCLLLE